VLRQSVYVFALRRVTFTPESPVLRASLRTRACSEHVEKKSPSGFPSNSPFEIGLRKDAFPFPSFPSLALGSSQCFPPTAFLATYEPVVRIV
jgi:hypothetical protein